MSERTDSPFSTENASTSRLCVMQQATADERERARDDLQWRMRGNVQMVMSQYAIADEPNMQLLIKGSMQLGMRSKMQLLLQGNMQLLIRAMCKC